MTFSRLERIFTVFRVETNAEVFDFVAGTGNEIAFERSEVIQIDLKDSFVFEGETFFLPFEDEIGYWRERVPSMHSFRSLRSS